MSNTDASWRLLESSRPRPAPVVERECRPLLHRCELEAAGVPLVEYFHLPRLHIPGKVGRKCLPPDRELERCLEGTIGTNRSRKCLAAAGLHRRLIARVGKFEEQIPDIGLLAVKRRPRFECRLCPPSLGKRQRRRTDHTQYDQGASVRMWISDAGNGGDPTDVKPAPYNRLRLS